MYSDPINTFLSLQNHSGDAVVYNSNTAFVTNAPWSGFGKLGKFGKRAIATAMLPIALGLGSQALAGGHSFPRNVPDPAAVETRINDKQELISHAAKTIRELSQQVQSAGGIPKLPPFPEQNQTTGRAGNPTLAQQDAVLEWQASCIEALQGQLGGSAKAGTTPSAGGASQQALPEQQTYSTYDIDDQKGNLVEDSGENINLSDWYDEQNNQELLKQAANASKPQPVRLKEALDEYQKSLSAAVRIRYRLENPGMPAYDVDAIPNSDPAMVKIARELKSQIGDPFSTPLRKDKLEFEKRIRDVQEMRFQLDRGGHRVANALVKKQDKLAWAEWNAMWNNLMVKSRLIREDRGQVDPYSPNKSGNEFFGMSHVSQDPDSWRVDHMGIGQPGT